MDTKMPTPDQSIRPLHFAGFKDDAKRFLRTQPLAGEVVKMCGTVLQREEHDHFYVAEAPLSAGLNPLLLVIKGPTGVCEFRNVLAVLPSWRIHSEPCNSALYRAALGRVRAKYKTLITALEAYNLVETLPVEVVDGRHCGNCVPLWLTKELAPLIEDARQCDVSARLISNVSEMLECREDDDLGVVPWNVLHLHSDKPDSATNPDWYIFEKWKSWEAQGFGPGECFAEFSKKHGKPGNQKAFNAHLAYLGLPTPRKPGTKPRRRRNWRFSPQQITDQAQDY